MKRIVGDLTITQKTNGESVVILNGVDISNQISDLDITMDVRDTRVSIVFVNPDLAFLTEVEEVDRTGTPTGSTEVRLVRRPGNRG